MPRDVYQCRVVWVFDEDLYVALTRSTFSRRCTTIVDEVNSSRHYSSIVGEVPLPDGSALPRGFEARKAAAFHSSSDRRRVDNATGPLAVADQQL